MLRGLTRFEDKNKSATSKSNYIANVAQDLCKGCGTCQKRCVFHAITIENEKAFVDDQKCMGCGLCAVTCPTGAIKLHRVERSHIFENQFELMKKIYEENRATE